jgi:hypothetical protein
MEIPAGVGASCAPGAEAPGCIPKPPEGGCEAPRRPSRSAGCRRRWDQPASAGLETEPGRSRPGDRGEGRSADLRCVSCETCRPRGIAAAMARAGEAAPRLDEAVDASPGAAPACTDRRCVNLRVVGVRRCLTRRPARAGTCGATGCPRCRAEWSRWQLPRQILPRRWPGGRGSASPLQGWGAASPIGDLGAMIRWYRAVL